ncbi:hypothetical protein PtA15_9A573 [Puccinia triticina]|uniref:Uncharacterized protein n=1 Tax=Puccinia triticina TaxID=208348 RepID=A0ABY7CT44_9BASI|nr:uncharacterized protein PtA15_9A573 [Puccinia triticina]WAQ88446.1 hypothetical protein PtA15_9A573 [Puccinia triticina]
MFASKGKGKSKSAPVYARPGSLIRSAGEDDDKLKTWVDAIYRDPEHARLFLSGNYGAFDLTPPKLYQDYVKSQELESVRVLIEKFKNHKDGEDWQFCKSKLIEPVMSKISELAQAEDNPALAKIAICVQALANISDPKVPTGLQNDMRRVENFLKNIETNKYDIRSRWRNHIRPLISKNQKVDILFQALWIIPKTPS